MAKKKILIVDDEASITRLLKFALEKTGVYEVVCENAGTKAMARIREAKPDLLILDVNMPDMGGGEISAAVAADPALKDTPVIFLTGSVTDEEADSGLEIGGHPALAKPINMEKFLQRIAKSLSAGPR